MYMSSVNEGFLFQTIIIKRKHFFKYEYKARQDGNVTNEKSKTKCMPKNFLQKNKIVNMLYYAK